jgi:hypothetical protein
MDEKTKEAINALDDIDWDEALASFNRKIIQPAVYGKYLRDYFDVSDEVEH